MEQKIHQGSSDTKKPLNIGIVFPRTEGGGVTHLQGIIPGLRERGHRVTLVTDSSGRSVEADVFKTYGIWPRPTDLYRFMPSATFNIFKILRTCDVIHIHTYPHFLCDYLTITQFIHKKPLVITFHGSLHQYTSSQLLFLKKLHNRFMLMFKGNIGKFIAVSYIEKSEVVKQGIPEEKVEVIYNGVSGEYANLKRIAKEQSKEKTILYLGRLTRSKNPELLVEAMKHVIGEDKDAKLILAGADLGMRRNLESLVSKLGMVEHIEFTGEVNHEQKMKLLASSDIFVHPSLQDVFSLALIEASAVGLPVVAFNVGGFSEMIVNGKTGILVDDLTPEGLSDAILKLLNDEKLGEKMGEEARKYVSGKFYWDEAVNGLEKVYYSVIEAKK